MALGMTSVYPVQCSGDTAHTATTVRLPTRSFGVSETFAAFWEIIFCYCWYFAQAEKFRGTRSKMLRSGRFLRSEKKMVQIISIDQG